VRGACDLSFRRSPTAPTMASMMISGHDRERLEKSGACIKESSFVYRDNDRDKRHGGVSGHAKTK